MLLIQNATIICSASELHLQTADILIEKGHIHRIAKKINDAHYDTEIIDLKGAFIGAGWVDIGTHTGDPGFEHRDDIDSIKAAAAAGGFTTIVCMPNTEPALDTKAQILYIKNKSANGVVNILPMGAVSQGCKGKIINEIYDMQQAGAVAFSDGKQPIQDGGLMLRALQYVKPFNGVIFNQPHDNSIVGKGEMNESLQSTLLGMKGAPALAEELMVQRDIYLAEYTDSRVHIHCISTAKSAELIRAAKAKGIQVTASVAAANLVFTDEMLAQFDTNYKLFPHLREAADQLALHKGIEEGTIDCIVSNHTPHDQESKRLEFAYAKYGMIALETAFALVNTHFPLTPTEWVERLAVRPRQILGLPVPTMRVGEAADFTIFSTDTIWEYTESDIYSKSRNTPLVGKSLTGKVIGIINNGQFLSNSDF